MSDKTMSDRAVLSLVLGGVASMTAGAITHPIDTCKVRLQNSRDGEYRNIGHALMRIVREERVPGLYKGLSAALLREGSYSTLRLGLYEPYKQMLGYSDRKNTPVWVKLAAGLMSGGTGSVISTPMDLLKVRLQNQLRDQKGILNEINTVI